MYKAYSIGSSGVVPDYMDKYSISIVKCNSYAQFDSVLYEVRGIINGWKLKII